MMPANKYRAITAGELPLLAENVNRALREGWQPHGSMQVLQLGLYPDGNPHYAFIQPMVLPHEPYTPATRFETVSGVAQAIVKKLHELVVAQSEQTDESLTRIIEQILSTGGRA